MMPILYIFSGLPGTGKTTIAKAIAKKYCAAYLRIDTIEHGLNEICDINVQGEGYRLSYRIAEDNLLIGNSVVADCCNPWTLTRMEWVEIAKKTNCRYLNIEVICSDIFEHRKRVEERKNDIIGFVQPDWTNVINRTHQEWTMPVIRIDTARRTREESIQDLIDRINSQLTDGEPDPAVVS